MLDHPPLARGARIRGAGGDPGSPECLPVEMLSQEGCRGSEVCLPPCPGVFAPLPRCVCPLWDFSRVRSPRSGRAAPAGTALPAPPLEAPGILPSHRLPATSRLAQHPAGSGRKGSGNQTLGEPGCGEGLRARGAQGLAELALLTPLPTPRKTPKKDLPASQM